MFGLLGVRLLDQIGAHLLGRGAGVGDDLLRLAARRVERRVMLGEQRGGSSRSRFAASIASSSACSRASTAVVIGPNANFDSTKQQDDEDDERPEHQARSWAA